METSVAARNLHSEMRIIENRNRRNRELKRHIVILFVSVVLFFVLITMFFSSSKSVAAGTDDVTLYKYYTSVQINSGDTLSGMAAKYTMGHASTDEFINEVLFINNMDDENSLTAGSYIVIPYYAEYQG